MPTPVQITERMLTTEEVSRLLRISHATVAALRRDGTLPSVKIGRMVRIPSGAVSKLMRCEVHQ